MKHTVPGTPQPVDEQPADCPTWCRVGHTSDYCEGERAEVTTPNRGANLHAYLFQGEGDLPVVAVFSEDNHGTELDLDGVDRLIADTERFLPQLRAMREQLAGRTVQNQPSEPSDLVVAVDVARRALQSTEHTSATDRDELNRAHGNLRESLRLVLRALGSEPLTDADTLRLTGRPVGAGGCGAPAAVRIEGYSARDGFAHGSLDLVVYACAQHAGEARAEWLGGLLTHSGPTSSTVCGDRFDYTTLGGGQ
ncbi:DUF6907 domain-containing protein [Streptomyces scabiei]|uniref:DUF6907 domain-containing protein n=1 Tax=Streptomyces scabiei TaxID=1930 RepID=UPI003796D20E